MRSVAASCDRTRLEFSQPQSFRSAPLQFRLVLNSVSDQDLLQNFFLDSCRLDQLFLMLNRRICVSYVIVVGFLRLRNLCFQVSYVLFFSLAMGSAVVSRRSSIATGSTIYTFAPGDSIPVDESRPACCRVWDLGVSEPGHLEIVRIFHSKGHRDRLTSGSFLRATKYLENIRAKRSSCWGGRLFCNRSQGPPWNRRPSAEKSATRTR